MTCFHCIVFLSTLCRTLKVLVAEMCYTSRRKSFLFSFDNTFPTYPPTITPSLDGLTCSRRSHSWLAEGPFTMSHKAETCLECVTSAPSLFVSSLRTAPRNCRAAVCRAESAKSSATHTDNVPTHTRGDNKRVSWSFIERHSSNNHWFKSPDVCP